MKWIELASRILEMSDKDQQKDVILWDLENESMEMVTVKKAHKTYYLTELLGNGEPVSDEDIEEGIQNGTDWGTIKRVIKKGDYFITIK